MIIACNKHPKGPILEAKDGVKKGVYFCPNCDNKVMLKKGEIKIPHFAHYPSENCYKYSEPESQEHLELKEFIYDKLKKLYSQIEKEKWIEDQRPDIYIESKKIAIECQCSPVTLESFYERNKKYTMKGIFVLWIFNHKLIRESVPEYLMSAYRLYYGRCYFWHNEKKVIFPIHFESAGRYIEETDFGGGYFKYYKKIKDMNIGENITSFSLLTTESNDCKIARFYDKKWW